MNPSIKHRMNYESDFSYIEQFGHYDADNNFVPEPIPDDSTDFEIEFWADDGRKFLAGRHAGKYSFCEKIDENRLRVYLPLSCTPIGTGHLRRKLRLHIPEGFFNGQDANICVPLYTGILLWDGPSDESDITPEIESLIGATIRGRDGKSAYDIAVRNGFEGTEQEWIASQKGSDGTSPTVSIIEDERTTVLQITDVNGTRLTQNLRGSGSASSVVVQHAEQVVGEWVDPKYADRLPLWERIFTVDLTTLAGTAGDVVPVTLDPSLRLEEGSYLRVVDVQCLSAGSYYNLADMVERIYQSGDALHADLRKPSRAEGELSVQMRYVKMQGDVVTFELKVPEIVGGVPAEISFPPLKYFKHVAFTPCFDDSSVTAWCNVFAFMNRRRVYTTDRGNGTEDYKYFHKAWTPTAADTFILYPEAFDYDNGTGRRIRYAFSCAIWGGRHDSAAAVKTPLLYKGICWDELRDIVDYGGSILYHDIEESLFDPADPASIREGFAYLRAQTKEKLGVLPKILGQPGGNVAYITAALSSPLVQFLRQGTPDDQRLIHTNRVYDLYHDHTRGGRAAAQQIAPKIEEIAAQMASDDPYWISFTRHEASRHGDDYALYKTLYDTYSKNADTDRLWVASWDAVYEWMYLRCHGRVEIDEAAIRTADGFTFIPCRLVAPRKESFLYRDASLVVDLHAAPGSCEVVNCSANVVRAESKVDGNLVRLNLNYNTQSVELAEKYVAVFESTDDEPDREAARYFTGWLSDELAAPFLARIDAVRDVPVEALGIDGPATLAYNATGTFTVTATPADNTHMERIVVTSSAGLSVQSRTIAGNVLTLVCRATGEGAQTLTATCGEVTAQHAVAVDAAPADVPITQITIEGPDTIEQAAFYTVTCLPENNTHMADVVASAEGGIAIGPIAKQNNVWVVTVYGTVNGQAVLRASAGSVSARKQIVVSGITAPAYRIVASLGWDTKVATGGVYDPDGGYTKIRPTASVPAGTLYLTDGTAAGTYAYTSSDIPKGAGASNRGPATGDDSAPYKDYAIQSYIYAGLSNQYAMQFLFAGLPAGRYVVRFFLNVGNTGYSRATVAGLYKFTTSEGDYPIAMPADDRDFFYQNHAATVDTQVVVGSNGEMLFSMEAAPDAKDNLVSVQILDIEKIE